MADKLRRYKALRQSCLGEIKILSDQAEAAKIDKTKKTIFKVRYAEIDLINSEFNKQHLNILTLLSADETQSLENEDITKAQFNKFYYNARAIYIDLFEADLNQSILQTTSNITSNHSQAKLPQIELCKFSGDHRQFQTFKDMFDAMVHTNGTLKDIEKFQYLISSLRGPPLALVQCTPMTAGNYPQAYSSFVKRYSNLRAQANAYWSEIEDHPPLDSVNATSLRKLMDTFSENLSGLKNLGISTDNWDFILINMLLKRLDSETGMAFEKHYHDANTIPTYKKLCEFLEEHCTALESVLLCSSEKSKITTSIISRRKSNVPPANFSRNNANMKTFKSNAFVTRPESQTPVHKCILCNENHPLYRCTAFHNKSQAERFIFCKTHRLCFSCLSNFHDLRTCQSTGTCRTCGNRSHHTLLHREKTESIPSTSSIDYKSLDNQQNTACPDAPNVNSCTATAPSTSRILLSTAMVEIRDGQGIYRKFRALLDSASETSIISQKCFNRLNLTKFHSPTTIQGVGLGNKLINSGGVTICLKPLKKENPVFLIDALILPQICDRLPTTHISLQSWSHISELELADPNFNSPSDIDILLGADIFSQVLLNGRVSGKPGEPAALQTVFGYVLLGAIDNISTKKVNTFFCSTYLDDTSLDNTMKQFFEIESVPENRSLSSDDQACEDIFIEKTYRDETGKFVVPLPFREFAPDFPGSRALAMQRFRSLERKLLQTPDLHAEYCNVIQGYLDQGHMEPISNSSISTSSFYLPHHCVVRPESTSTKVRVVFNASAKLPEQNSLNQCLYTGQKLQTDISTVLLNFRFHQTCFTSDMFQMYRMIWIHPQYRDYQRLVFRFSPREKISDFRIKCLCFGFNCAPYLALRCIKQLILDESDNFPRASAVLKTDIYVDDICTGSSSLSEAEALRDEIINLLNKGGFSLRKWASNNSDFLKGLPPEYVSTDPLNFDKDASRKILGLNWSPLLDCFSFSVCPLDRTCTKRNLLSELARIYDPLGMLAPITFFTKQLIQKLWLLGLNWDEPPPEEILRLWHKYRLEVHLLSKVKIPRRIVSDNFASVEIHGFSDASEKGYGSVIYFRVLTATKVSIFFVCGKSKVAPTKKITIPRLELCGAVLLTKLISWVVRSYEGKISFSRKFAYTDSQIVLAWLRADVTRWTTFVANRVSYIQDKIPSSFWLYVKSHMNPADCASRGLFPSEILNHDLWFQGPDFLYEKNNICSDITNNFETHEEERKIALTLQSKTNIIEILLDKISNFEKIQHILTIILRFLHRYMKANALFLRSFGLSKNSPNESTALEILIKRTQLLNFSNELESRKMSKPLKKLNVFLDSKGILRVGGRLTYSNLDYDKKHPILLPRKGRFTQLLIEFYHKKYFHVGLKTVQFLISQKFWILSAVRAIRSVLGKCIRCWRTNPVPLQPLMGNLPVYRISQVKPFSHTGVDYGGPFLVTMSRRRGCKAIKVYVCLFVCMATKALHLELASDLTSEAFVAALRRFIARRGRCSHLYSDQGTNFVGAHNFLKSLLPSISASESVEHHFLVPSAPHMGGIWEAGIKSVKTHIKRVIGEQILSYEEFNTLLVQIESVLNSRPLTPVSSDPNDMSALTPGHFLTLEPLCPLPEEDLTNIPMNRLNRWQMIQRLNANFWHRWHLEYLHTLQQRSKWLVPGTPINPGSLVLIKKDNSPPLQWNLGRILELHPGGDGVSRIATVKTATGVLQRPLVKLCALPDT